MKEKNRETEKGKNGEADIIVTEERKDGQQCQQ